MTPPLVTPLVGNEASIDEALTRILDRKGEQIEQMSQMTEQEKAVHVERESLREVINSIIQEVSKSEKRLKERTDEHLAQNLSRLTRKLKEERNECGPTWSNFGINKSRPLGLLLPDRRDD